MVVQVRFCAICTSGRTAFCGVEGQINGEGGLIDGVGGLIIGVGGLISGEDGLTNGRCKCGSVLS